MSKPSLFTLNALSFGYGKDTVLNQLDLQLQQGTFYGLIGGNGSGKSTLLELLMGILAPVSGSILYRDKELKEYTRQELATRLALVPQHFSMDFDYGVRDIILMGRHPHIPRFSSPSPHDIHMVEEAMSTMDILHLQQRPITALSGGELQRVVMARALAQETEVLILDEATSNLDIQHTIAIMRVIKERVKKSGLTVIAAIHDLNLAAAFCDECLVLKDTELHSSGPVEQLFTAELINDVFEVEASVNRASQSGCPRITFHY
jgi:iron complex transport system ATP-binding protein